MNKGYSAASRYRGYAQINRVMAQATWNLMTFPEALAMQNRLMGYLADASKRINSLPGVGGGPMGLTPDEYKTPALRAARMAYEAHRQELGRFNSWFLKRWKAESRKANAERLASGR
jgi:hypothetical protein